MLTKKRIIIICIIVVVLIILKLLIDWGNKALVLTSHCITSTGLPPSFEGFRIAQVSDFHNAEMGEENKKLISMLKESNPDIIILTGDMIYCRNPKPGIALCFAEEAMKIAPCYYVTGNHEARIDNYAEFKNGLIDRGVIVLENAKVNIEKSGEKITIIGVNDPLFKNDGISGNSENVINTRLKKLMSEDNGYTILLSHRPELFKTYVNNNVDLVFSGHAHGGQVILPFIGGLAAPNQGIFPKYYKGIYSESDTKMIVSRGIGRSVVPVRVNNRPEVVLAELWRE